MRLVERGMPPPARGGRVSLWGGIWGRRGQDGGWELGRGDGGWETGDKGMRAEGRGRRGFVQGYIHCMP